MGKFSLFIFAFILTGIQAGAQVNYCEIFFNAFNSAGQGFPAFRPATVDSTSSSFDIDEKILEPYGFRSGIAHMKSALSSKKFPGHSYSVWELTLNSRFLNVGEMSQEEAIVRLRPDFESRAKLLHESCLMQLSMSDIYTRSSEYSPDIYAYIYYPAEINPDQGLSFENALEVLDETFFITATLRKSSFINSYSIRYTVHGVQYDR